MTDPGAGVWVYAVCEGLDDGAINSVSGVDGETPRQIGAEGLTAVVGTVDLSRFGTDGLQRSLNDLDQLAAIAQAHHAVVQLAAVAGPAAPTRLATVYDDDERVREMLAEHREAFVDALRHVAGRQEWGVKAYGADRPDEAPEQADAVHTTGTAYLRQRRAALSSRDASRRRVSAAADELFERLSPLAADARRHRPQDPQLSGDKRTMVVNDAYLVDVDAAEAFGRAVAGLAEVHPELAVELTGPWPPYSFAVIEQEATP